MNDLLQGISAPLDPGGVGNLYGPTPWRFTGRSLSVIARCADAGVRSLIPAPLTLHGPPIVRFSVHRLICDYGFGWEWVQTHPERSQFYECVIGIVCQHGDLIGHWDPFLWSNSDAEVCVGREMFGWPHRMADLWLTEPHPQDGWRAGDRVVGRVTRYGREMLEISATLDGPGEIKVEQPPFVCFFTERALPDPAARTLTRDLFASDMEAVKAGDPWQGAKGSVRLLAPELQPLKVEAVLGAGVRTISWIKHKATLISRRTMPYAEAMPARPPAIHW